MPQEERAKHLDFNKPTHQAIAAKEIRELYLWWTVDRPARVEPYEASGWSAYCDERHKAEGDSLSFLDEEKTPEQKAHVHSMLEMCHALEKQYDDEDTAMCVRLLNIRKALWV